MMAIFLFVASAWIFSLTQPSSNALSMIEFSMSNTLLQFQGQCCEHAGGVPIEERGLTTGGCGSAWVADLLAACVLDMESVKKHFDDTASHHGIYRDDGLCVFLKENGRKEM